MLALLPHELHHCCQTLDAQRAVQIFNEAHLLKPLSMCLEHRTAQRLYFVLVHGTVTPQCQHRLPSAGQMISQSSLPEHCQHVMACYVQSRTSGRDSFGRADLQGARRLCSFALHTLRNPLHALHQPLACLGAGGLYAALSM